MLLFVPSRSYRKLGCPTADFIYQSCLVKPTVTLFIGRGGGGGSFCARSEDFCQATTKQFKRPTIVSILWVTRNGSVAHLKIHVVPGWDCFVGLIP